MVYKIYLSGPIAMFLETGEYKKHFSDMKEKAFNHYSLYFKDLYIYNPADLSDTLSYETALGRCINILSSGYNHIVMLDGWEKSRGARLEIVVASHLGINIVDSNFKKIKNERIPTITFLGK